MKCPCHSESAYEMCCQPYHLGTLAENALKLMRSRYSGYALGLTDYIIATTHSNLIPSDQKTWRHSIEQFSQTTQFEGLEILEFIDGEHAATVTFKAILFSMGKDCSFQEKSHFIKEQNRWLYHSGVMSKS